MKSRPTFVMALRAAGSMPLSNHMKRAMSSWAFFGLLAVVLVATGLYGTLTYHVNNRTVEIGVRMAVGAQRWTVVWMVLRDSLLLTGIGVVAGVPLAILLARALTSALYGVKPYDAMSYVLAVVAVVLVAVVASAIPARRAASVEPLTALRAE